MLATALVISCALPVSAQIRFGIKAGYNHASMSFSDDYVDLLEFIGGETVEIQPMSLFHAGAVLEFGLGSHLGLATGIQLQAKGSKQTYSGVILNTPYSRTFRTVPMYVQVPLSFTYRSHGFYVGAGPYAGYAVTGKLKIKTESGGSSTESSENLKFGKDEKKDFGTMDYGATLELGYEFFGSLRFSASYSLGLANIVPADEVAYWDDLGATVSAKNKAIGVSLTYLFGGE